MVFSSLQNDQTQPFPSQTWLPRHMFQSVNSPKIHLPHFSFALLTTSITPAVPAQKMTGRVLDELHRTMASHGGALSFDALQDMDVLHRWVTEALRLKPLLVPLMRYACTPFTVTTSSGKEFNILKVRCFGCPFSQCYKRAL